MKKINLNVCVDREISLNSIFCDIGDIIITEIRNDKAILIYDNKIRGLIGGEQAEVVLQRDGIILTAIINVDNNKIDENKLIDKIYNPIELNSLTKLSKRSDFVFGADISMINEVLTQGGKFYNANGNEESIFSLLRAAEFDCIRLRLWNDPNFIDGAPYGGGHNDIDTDIKIARIVKAMGFKLMIDFHYSDFWADPAKQSIPKNWRHLRSVSEVEKTIFNYTYTSILKFQDNGAKPDFIQVGNEITNGLIQHNAYIDGDDISHEKKKIHSRICGNFKKASFLRYLNAGCNAVREFNNIKIVIHIDRGADNKRCTKFYRRISKVKYDIIGLSYYSFYHGSIDSFKDNVVKLASKFAKPILVAETSYAFTESSHVYSESVFAGANNAAKSWEISPQGQADKIRAISDVLLNLPDNLGQGVCYWEPCWLPLKGVGWAKCESKSSWSDQALFSYEGVQLPSLNTPKLLKNKLK